MRVVHLSNSDLDGGAARAAFRIHKSMKNVDIDSTMLVLKKVSQDPSVVCPKTLSWKISQTIGVTADRVPVVLASKFGQGFPGYASPAWIGARFLSKLNDMNPDLVHLHWIFGGFIRFESLFKIRKPLVWRLADAWPMLGVEHYPGASTRYKDGYISSNPFNLDSWVYKRKLRVMSRLDDLTIVCPSTWLASMARESRLLRKFRVEVIRTGHDLTRFRPLPKEVARSILGIRQDKKVILFGAMHAATDKRKGFHLLINSLRQLSGNEQRRTSWHAVIFGSDRPAASPDLGFQDTYLGRLYDDLSLAVAYSAADVFLAPAMEDNLPNTALEAMACGTPVVAFRIGGLPDLIAHKSNGYLAEPFDVADFAKGVEWVLESHDDPQVLSNKARNTMVEKFSLDEQARSYRDLYLDILKNRQTKTVWTGVPQAVMR